MKNPQTQEAPSNNGRRNVKTISTVGAGIRYFLFANRENVTHVVQAITIVVIRAIDPVVSPVVKTVAKRVRGMIVAILKSTNTVCQTGVKNVIQTLKLAKMAVQML